MLNQVLSMLSGAMLSLAFVAPKPYCYVAAVVCAVAVCIVRR